MTKQETVKALAVLRVAYPAFYSKMKEQDIEMAVALWSRAFAGVDYRIVNEALQQLIMRHIGYPPDIAAVRRYIDEMTLAALGEPTDEELWRMLADAASNGYYDSVKEFNRLPPILKRYLGGPSALVDLSLTDSKTFQTVVKGQFLKQIVAIRERERFDRETPDAIKALLADTAKQHALPPDSDSTALPSPKQQITQRKEI